VSGKYPQGYLDVIFDAIKINQSVKEFQISKNPNFKLNLKNLESLRFIEVNSTITMLNLNWIVFTEEEIYILGDTLKKNKSITNLDFSRTNYSGSFDFLQNNILKNFSFVDLWNLTFDFQNFLFNLKSNESLIELDVSYRQFWTYGEIEKEMNEIHEFIDTMSGFKGNIYDLKLNYLGWKSNTYPIFKLLKNPKIQKLELMSCLSIKSVVDFMEELKSNETLTSLNLSDSNNLNWDEIQFSNQNIVDLYMKSKSEFATDQRM
jgi:hypothetical protein